MSEKPTIELQNIGNYHFVECKFTVENDERAGGDFKENMGGSWRRRRISFEGYATSELYVALIDAVQKVVGE